MVFISDGSHELTDLCRDQDDGILQMLSKGEVTMSVASESSTSVKSTSFGGFDGEDDDALSILSVSTPRSRLGSEHLFDDFESVIQSSSLPPVGTTRPPLYPRPHPFEVWGHADADVVMSNEEVQQSPKRTFKRLVNKPIKPTAASLRLEGGSN